MRAILTVLLAGALLAATPAGAAAKGSLSSAQVCGASGCNTVDTSSLPALADGVAARPPARPVAFFTLRTTIDMGPDAPPRILRVDYLPSLGLTRPSGSRDDTRWVQASGPDRALLDHVVAPFQPYPASRLARGAPVAHAHASGATPWLTLAAASAAAIALLALLARYATSALKARPRASKSSN